MYSQIRLNGNSRDRGNLSLKTKFPYTLIKGNFPYKLFKKFLFNVNLFYSILSQIYLGISQQSTCIYMNVLCSLVIVEVVTLSRDL